MPRMGLGLQPGQRQIERQQLVHMAVWSTYASSRARPADPVNPFGPQPLIQALESLDELSLEILRNGDRTSLMLIGTALWDLLGVYGKKTPPKEFSKLLLDMLALDVERARELRAQPSYKVFPPFPEDPFMDPESYAKWGPTPLVQDSSFTVRKKSRTAESAAHVSLELCVERDFDNLSALANPVRWHELCPVIWDDMKVTDDGWKGGLRLPGIERDVIDVTFVDTKGSLPNAARNDAELQIVPSPWIKEGRLEFRMEPESSRPGWTRIVHSRDVTFSSALHPHEASTLSYWTKSEIACLALR